MDLVRLAVTLGDRLQSVVHVPLIGMLLRTMRAPAHVAGFGALQEFLETGFVTFRRISDIESFLELLHARMERVFDRIYRSPID